MASGGSSDRTSSNQRSFGFGSDDVLCAYDEYTNQDQSNGRRSDLSSIKEYNESRTGRQLTASYGRQDEYPKEDIVNVVEKSMKKYADNLMRHLEGISGRLSQLEVHCYKLDRSIGEFHSDMIRDQNETDTKLKSLEKHLQEVHRSIQILRDKQELAETQKELTKLQLSSPPKDTSIEAQSKKSKESDPPPVSEHNHDIPNPHLALALTHQTPAPPLPAPQAPQAQGHDHYALNQPSQYTPYTQPRPQMMNQSQSTHSYPTYPTQYPQQQPVAPPQPQQPIRPHTSFGYFQTPPQPNLNLPTQQLQNSFAAPPAKPSGGYESGAPYPTHSSGFQGYNYGVDGSRAQPYPPSSYPPGSSGSGYHQTLTRAHPYADMIEKAVNMGYPTGQVVSLINMMADSGQQVDFNALLDRLNSGGAGRAWSN